VSMETVFRSLSSRLPDLATVIGDLMIGIDIDETSEENERPLTEGDILAEEKGAVDIDETSEENERPLTEGDILAEEKGAVGGKEGVVVSNSEDILEEGDVMLRVERAFERRELVSP